MNQMMIKNSLLEKKNRFFGKLKQDDDDNIDVPNNEKKKIFVRKRDGTRSLLLKENRDNNIKPNNEDEKIIVRKIRLKKIENNDVKRNERQRENDINERHEPTSGGKFRTYRKLRSDNFDIRKNKIIKVEKKENEENNNKTIDINDINNKRKTVNKDKNIEKEVIENEKVKTFNKLKVSTSKFQIFGKEKHENVFIPLDGLEIFGIEKEENIIEPIDGFELYGLEKYEDIYFEPVNEIELLGQEKQEDKIVPIDEIEILGKEKMENVYAPIDEIQVIGRKTPENYFEPIDEIQLYAKKRPENVIELTKRLKILGKEKPSELNEIFFDFDSKNESKITEKKLKLNFLYNEDVNISGSKREKIKEINELKQQVEIEREKIKNLFRRIIQLENELNE